MCVRFVACADEQQLLQLSPRRQGQAQGPGAIVSALPVCGYRGELMLGR